MMKAERAAGRATVGPAVRPRSRSAWTRRSEMSTNVTSWPSSRKPSPVAVPTTPDPTMTIADGVTDGRWETCFTNSPRGLTPARVPGGRTAVRAIRAPVPADVLPDGDVTARELVWPGGEPHGA